MVTGTLASGETATSGGVAVDLGISLPFDKALAALFDLIKVNRETMSQANRDRSDDLALRILEAAINPMLPKLEPKP